MLIEHQDGSTSFCTHMMPSGVFPKVGDVVERGQKVIVVGQTGNASDPQLSAAFQPLPCQVPAKGSAWVSLSAPQ